MKLNRDDIYNLTHHLWSLENEYRRKIWIMEEEGRVTERVKKLFDHNVSNSDLKTLIEIVEHDIDQVKRYREMFQQGLKDASST